MPVFSQIAIKPMTAERRAELKALKPLWPDHQVLRFAKYNNDLHAELPSTKDINSVPWDYDRFVMFQRIWEMPNWKHSDFFLPGLQAVGERYPDYDIGRPSASVKVKKEMKRRTQATRTFMPMDGLGHFGQNGPPTPISTPVANNLSTSVGSSSSSSSSSINSSQNRHGRLGSSQKLRTGRFDPYRSKSRNNSNSQFEGLHSFINTN